MNSPLLTLLEAAKYVEYRSEAKARGKKTFKYVILDCFIITIHVLFLRAFNH